MSCALSILTISNINNNVSFAKDKYEIKESDERTFINFFKQVLKNKNNVTAYNNGKNVTDEMINLVNSLPPSKANEVIKSKYTDLEIKLESDEILYNNTFSKITKDYKLNNYHNFQQRRATQRTYRVGKISGTGMSKAWIATITGEYTIYKGTKVSWAGKPSLHIEGEKSNGYYFTANA